MLGCAASTSVKIVTDNAAYTGGGTEKQHLQPRLRPELHMPAAALQHLTLMQST
jgi:hypothetical protein